MAKTPDGGPVFPQIYIETKGNKATLTISHPGISTRRLFAGFAMCGLLSRGAIGGEALTENAIDAADRLLKGLDE